MSSDIMEKYEKTIGLKTIWLTIIRRYLAIFLVFIPVAVATVIYTQFVMKKTYVSSVTLTKQAGIAPSMYAVIPLTVKSNKTAEAVYNKLKEMNPTVQHADGSEITINEIYNGVNVAASISSTVYQTSFSFQSTDKTITRAVLQSIVDVSLPTIQATLSETTASQASNPVKNSGETKWLAIGLAAGVVLAYGFAFAYEIISDEVYDKEDVERLGCGGFEFTVSK